MSQEIKTPCGFCGQEAQTETGVHYIGKSIYDPDQKPACVACVKDFEEKKKNRKIQFKITLHNSYPICQECYALVMPGHEKDHAKGLHNCDKWEIIKE